MALRTGCPLVLDPLLGGARDLGRSASQRSINEEHAISEVSPLHMAVGSSLTQVPLPPFHATWVGNAFLKSTDSAAPEGSPCYGALDPYSCREIVQWRKNSIC